MGRDLGEAWGDWITVFIPGRGHIRGFFPHDQEPRDFAREAADEITRGRHQVYELSLAANGYRDMYPDNHPVAARSADPGESFLGRYGKGGA
jgi:hypothetical protein